MVLEAAGLWFYLTTYPEKNKHKDKYFVKEISSKYEERQQKCSVTQERIINKKNNSRSNHIKEDYDNGQIGDTGRNQKE